MKRIMAMKVSGYTGEETDLVLPSSIDGTDMKGVAAVAFKDNTKITSVEVSGWNALD